MLTVSHGFGDVTILSKEDNDLLCRVGAGTAEKVLEPGEDWRRLGTEADPVVLAATVDR
jgi:hypothetical protein